jgi:hypothetical protein
MIVITLVNGADPRASIAQASVERHDFVCEVGIFSCQTLEAEQHCVKGAWGNVGTNEFVLTVKNRVTMSVPLDALRLG